MIYTTKEMLFEQAALSRTHKYLHKCFVFTNSLQSVDASLSYIGDIAPFKSKTSCMFSIQGLPLCVFVAQNSFHKVSTVLCKLSH